MTKLGSYPSHRYHISWLTQRFANYAPSWSHLRKIKSSIGQQLINPICIDMQDTLQQLNNNNKNTFLSTADMSLISHLYRFDLPKGVVFNSTEDSTGNILYTPPTIYATINGTEYEITQAQNNDLQTIGYDVIPSRIEYNGINYSYNTILPTTSISNLSSSIPNSIIIDGHIYITVSNNSVWQVEYEDKIYFSKVFITGKTRKGTNITEVVPIRYNGTFKSINEWSEINEISTSYIDDNAYITIETFPINRDSYIDSQNINILPGIEDPENIQFTKINNRTYGSTFISESFIVNLDLVRKTGANEKNINYEIELLDSNSNNIYITDFIHKPQSRFIYAISDDKFYVYDTNVPYPDVTLLTGESSDPKIELYSKNWIVNRDDTTLIKTINQDILNIAFKYRMSILYPDGTTYYIGKDSSLWPDTIDAWIDNDLYEDGYWDNFNIQLSFPQQGTYIFSLEAQYLGNDQVTVSTLTSKYLFFVPTIIPEVEFTLPSELQDSSNIVIDSDNNVFLLKYSGLNKLDVFHDYFIADYEQNRLWFKEEYSSVRVKL